MKGVTVETVFDSAQDHTRSVMEAAFDLIKLGECMGFIKPDKTGISECDVELMHYEYLLDRMQDTLTELRGSFAYLCHKYAEIEKRQVRP